MKTFLWFAVTGILLSSCGSPQFIQHTPTLVNDGTHTGKGQLKATSLYSTGSSSSNNSLGAGVYDRVNGIQLQGSFSFAKNWSAQGAFMHSTESAGQQKVDVPLVETYRHWRNIAEPGISYFSAFNPQSDFYYSLGVGTGFGRYRSIENLTTATRYYNSNIFKFYFQPILYWTKSRTTISLGTKFSTLSFNSIKSNYTQEERTRRNLSFVDKKNPFTMDLSLRAEWMFGKTIPLGLVFQIQACNDISGRITEQYTNSNYGIGLVFKAGKWLQ